MADPQILFLVILRSHYIREYIIRSRGERGCKVSYSAVDMAADITAVAHEEVVQRSSGYTGFHRLTKRASLKAFYTYRMRKLIFTPSTISIIYSFIFSAFYHPFSHYVELSTNYRKLLILR